MEKLEFAFCRGRGRFCVIQRGLEDEIAKVITINQAGTLASTPIATVDEEWAPLRMTRAQAERVRKHAQKHSSLETEIAEVVGSYNKVVTRKPK